MKIQKTLGNLQSLSVKPVMNKSLECFEISWDSKRKMKQSELEVVTTIFETLFGIHSASGSGSGGGSGTPTEP